MGFSNFKSEIEVAKRFKHIKQLAIQGSETQANQELIPNNIGMNDIQDRLGNVILLEKDELKRSNFEDKKAFLNNYQAWLAEQAVNTWNE